MRAFVLPCIEQKVFTRSHNLGRVAFGNGSVLSSHRMMLSTGSSKGLTKLCPAPIGMVQENPWASARRSPCVVTSLMDLTFDETERVRAW